MFLPASPVPETGVPGVRHSTFVSLRLGRSSQSIASCLLRFWDSLNFKKDNEFMGIMVFFLDEKISCSSMYMIIDHPFLIRFISPTIIDEVITGAPEINLQSRLDYSTISKCGWANPFCPGLLPHQRNNLNRYLSPH
uniref:Uncharacterized protein n=1 Tax=Brassica oleracea var. oleracea TaxID=109376 RepID=A0A0D3CHS9_BRAOL